MITGSSFFLQGLWSNRKHIWWSSCSNKLLSELHHERCIFQKLFNCHNGLDCWKRCDEFPFVQKLFLRLCIYYGLKFVNHELSNTKKKNRKKWKVAHLTLTPLKYIFYTKVHKSWTVRYKTGVKSNVDGNHTQVKLLRCCYTE
jgi:hypothetical protein